MPHIGAIPVNSIPPVPSDRNHTATGHQSLAGRCMNALSAHLGSQLHIAGIQILGDMVSDENANAYTKLIFSEDLANARTVVHIHLIREDLELIIDDLALPPEHDPLDMLFRAVATAANAARDPYGDISVATDRDMQALRRAILSEANAIAPAATQPQRSAKAGAARRTARISFHRRHTTSPVSPEPAAPRHGVKRRYPDDPAEPIQSAATAIGDADEPAENAHASSR